MKNIIYSVLALILIFASCSSNDDNNKVIRCSPDDNEIVDIVIYVGSAKGGIPLVYDTIENKTDSVRNAKLNYFFNGHYNQNLYSKMTIEFNDDYVTYVDPASSKKIISKYILENDSLFALKSDGKKVYIATGTSNNLYRKASFTRYTSPSTAKDTITTHKDIQTLEDVLQYANYTSLQDMKKLTDTIAWSNVKYIFK